MLKSSPTDKLSADAAAALAELAAFVSDVAAAVAEADAFFSEVAAAFLLASADSM